MPMDIEQTEWREARALPRKQELAQRIQLAHVRHRLIETTRQSGWGLLYQAGCVADSRQKPGQEAV